ncbi:phosphate ABC transporter substrate-binding protein PstS [Synechocystis sp. PCC 7339]|uniref:phosphate ABC transporter substrate-binding protein PstS n=1 Tax=unclassified Synechocystis TaxID=2640012 RepID=UPI001BB0731C|nr:MULTISPECIES: phosphate ABC transporter substrate-binding protein PstS [unclassified Synechocystis]QUS59914.1 phosphate ABC transporter substrate-binding protein PstS [Synechocystis sp. PCC 7338]UAJ72627.1 phosphate ABC transporter substrate-binding protein PstS [Synechocystis sp. PCC 7339]
MLSSFQKVATFSVVSVIVGFGGIGQAIAGTLNGAGASFPAPLYQRYFAEYKKATGNTVNYNSVGSGAGIRQFIGETVDFGATDAVPTSAQRQQMKRGVVMVPTAGGSVAVVYNLPGKKVQLSRIALGKIFTGELKTWNQIDSKLPNMPIRVVVRADGSGTTDIFTSHLSAINSTFRSKIGASQDPNWGFQVLKGPKNDGVAAMVKQTPGAIGYVQDTFARRNEGPNLQTAKVQNKAGQYVEPSLAEANKAISGAKFDANFVAEINDPASGYPIVGLTWLLVYQNNKNATVAKDIKALVRWILTTGQNHNTQLEYTKIPPAVAQRAIAAVDKIK